MKKVIIKLFIFLFVFSFFSCQQEDVLISESKVDDVNMSEDFRINKKALTLQLINNINSSNNLEALVSELLYEGKPVVLKNLKSIGLDLAKELETNSKLALVEGVVEIPELWFLEGKDDVKKHTILFSFAPDEKEEMWDYILAFDINGNEYHLDVNENPDYSVVVLEPNGKYTLHALVKLMNENLDAYGVQYTRPVLKSSAGINTTVLKSIVLKNDLEPWIKGKSEIYAICSGVVEKDGEIQAQIRIIEMPYLDYAGTEYKPNQIMLFWKDYDYQAANIQFFEHDSNYNYKELVKILITGVFKITSAATSQPMVSLVGDIASEIINVMPENWFTDDDDYVDSYYTLMKGKTYTNISGANNNATASFEPLFIPSNN